MKAMTSGAGGGPGRSGAEAGSGAGGGPGRSGAGGGPRRGGAEAAGNSGGRAGHDAVRIYEVGPRDGLQNESRIVPTGDKRRFVGLLAEAGLHEIEATSFVSPRAVPQLADADELVRSLPGDDGNRYPVLVPNA
jgi:hydroxymethylglutaryl-CoA lyase